MTFIDKMSKFLLKAFTSIVEEFPKITDTYALNKVDMGNSVLSKSII